MTGTGSKGMRCALACVAVPICGCVPVPQLLVDIETTNQGSVTQAIVPTTTGFYLAARSAEFGDELFYTPDGTVEGATSDNVIDVRPGALSSSPKSVYTVGERAYFHADDGTQPDAATNPQRALYVTDGTLSTTQRLLGPRPDLKFTALAPWGTGGMIFKMSDASTGEELFRTDGTPAGTQMIADINPTGSSQPDGLTPVGDGFVFAATDGAGDRELWRTDGITATQVANLNATGSSAPSGFVTLAGLAYFSATPSPGTMWLYRTDGTAGGTVRVATVAAASLSIGVASSTQVFFVVDKSQLWVSDGTLPGTHVIASIPLNSSGYPPREFRTVGGRVVFYVETDASDMDIVEDVWSSDGTAAGTSVFLPGHVAWDHGVRFASKLYLTGPGGILRTDGTAGGTETVYAGGLGFLPRHLTNVQGTLFMTADDPTHGNELWTMDESIGPPTFFFDVNPGNGSSSPAGFTPLGEKTLFVALQSMFGRELYATDGTASGTGRLVDILPGPNSSFPRSFEEHDGFLYFTANDLTHGDELWRTDGTAAGTSLVADISPGSSSSQAFAYLGPNGILYLNARNATLGHELWRSDGTAAGTVLVKDINPGSSGSRPSAFAPLGSRVLFAATTAAEGPELWSSDGTPAGTQLVKDINQGTGSSDITVAPVPMGGHLYVAATDGVHGKELWRTDGTNPGTARLTDLNPGAGHSVRGHPVVMGTAVYFEGFDGTRHEMWKTDGVGVVNVTSAINPAGSNAVPGVVMGDALYFTATDPEKGNELFATDGTPGGVRLVKDINPADGKGSSIEEMTVLGDMLYFVADDGSNGRELWSTDGTTEGTVMNTGANGDPFGSSPGNLAVSGGVLYMQLTDPVTGAEPYFLRP